MRISRLRHKNRNFSGNFLGILCATAIFTAIFANFYKPKAEKISQQGEKNFTINFSQIIPPDPKPREKKPEKITKTPEKTIQIHKPIAKKLQEIQEPKNPPKKELAPRKTPPDPKQRENLTPRPQTNQQNPPQKSIREKISGVSDEFLQKIREAIATVNKYPKRARVRGLTGIVVVEFFLHPDGKISSLKITKTDASEILQNAAIRAVQDAVENFSRPKNVVKITAPLEYVIQ